ncbi:hypothetical protein M885DRAFT_518013 [Pelagophyceae sp. CCMP2097]|nr:hypothetical protein M885DRAFT_518013 [Pelagophyceae sp. CCMP2097]
MPLKPKRALKEMRWNPKLRSLTLSRASENGRERPEKTHLPRGPRKRAGGTRPNRGIKTEAEDHHSAAECPIVGAGAACGRRGRGPRLQVPALRFQREAVQSERAFLERLSKRDSSCHLIAQSPKPKAKGPKQTRKSTIPNHRHVEISSRRIFGILSNLFPHL